MQTYASEDRKSGIWRPEASSKVKTEERVCPPWVRPPLKGQRWTGGATSWRCVVAKGGGVEDSQSCVGCVIRSKCDVWRVRGNNDDGPLGVMETNKFIFQLYCDSYNIIFWRIIVEMVYNESFALNLINLEYLLKEQKICIIGYPQTSLHQTSCLLYVP